MKDPILRIERLERSVSRARLFCVVALVIAVDPFSLRVRPRPAPKCDHACRTVVTNERDPMALRLVPTGDKPDPCRRRALEIGGCIEADDQPGQDVSYAVETVGGAKVPLRLVVHEKLPKLPLVATPPTFTIPANTRPGTTITYHGEGRFSTAY